MKPPEGTYRLSSPGAPSMDVVVAADGTTRCTLDTFDYLPETDLLRARSLSCAMECTGTGTGIAFVGKTPGFVVPLTCVRL